MIFKEGFMKNMNELKNNNLNEVTSENFQPSFHMPVYNEMLDQTSQNLDVVQMIQSQFEELHKISMKRKFLLKEISQYLK
jgi:hypothetical protein